MAARRAAAAGPAPLTLAAGGPPEEVGRSTAAPLAAGLAPVGCHLGIFLLPLGVAMLLTAAADGSVADPDWQAFVGASAITLLAGGCLALAFRGSGTRLSARQAGLLALACWLVLPLFAALPLQFGSLRLAPGDALLEAVAGLTTTSATSLADLDHLPPGILLWRSLLQWLGGALVLALATLILAPPGRAAGDPLELLSRIALAYVTLTIACAMGYWLAGMGRFDAGLHAMATLSTGGHSTHEASLGHFASPSVNRVAIGGMLLAGLPLALLLRAAAGRHLRRGALVAGSVYLGLALVASLGLALWLVRQEGLAFLPALEQAGFEVAATLSTTGFASDSVDLRQMLVPLAVLLALATIGGCVGSTAGGLKVDRVLGLLPGRRPHGPALLVTGGYLASLAAVAAGLHWLGFAPMVSLSAAIGALGNGSGLGPVISAVQGSAMAGEGARWLLILAMLAGRMELVLMIWLIRGRPAAA